jgi:hypothetical protein
MSKRAEDLIDATLRYPGTGRQQIDAAVAPLLDALVLARRQFHCYQANNCKEQSEMAGQFAWGHWCPACDEYVDRNGEQRAAIKALLAEWGR